MLGKIFSHLLGNADGDLENMDDAFDDNQPEFEDEGWIIVNLPADRVLSTPPDLDSLENLLIGQPSMSVYQRRRGRSCSSTAPDKEEQEEEEQEEEEHPRPVALLQPVSWRLAAWGVPVSCPTVRPRALSDTKKLSRGVLQRRNLTMVRPPPRERGVAYFKQPPQRTHNY